MVGCLGGCIGSFLGVGLTKFKNYADVQILSRRHVGEKAYPKLQHPQKSSGWREQLQYAMVPHGPYLFTWTSEV